MKRTLAVVLSVLMVLSCVASVFSTVAFAEEPVSGTYPILSALSHGDGDITILAGKIEGADKSTVVDRSAYSHDSDFAPGDVNNNGEIDAADYFIVRKSTLGSYQMSEEEFLRADINQDGEVDARDYLAVKKHVLTSGLENGYSLPAKLTINEPGYKYEDYALIVVGADNKVVSLNLEEGDKSATEIPEGGYVIGFNRALLTGDAPKYDIAKIEEGTELELIGITVEEVAALTAPKALEGASFSIVETEPEHIGKYPIKTFAGYAAKDVNILLRQGDKKTLSEVSGGRDYNYYRVILVDADGFVTEVLETLGRAEVAHSEGDGRKDLVEIPEGGFALGFHNDAIVTEPDSAVYADLFGENGVKVGDGIELFGIDLEATAASAKPGDQLAGVTFDLVHYEEVPEGAYVIDYAQDWMADIAAIYTRLSTGEKTFGEVTAVTTGEAKDSTWWNAILVDAEGKVVKVIGMTDKTNEEIPEGGFMICAHGSSPVLNVLPTIELGSKVTLYNCDLDAFANLKEGIALKKAAFTVTAPEIERPVSYQKSYTTSENTRTDGWADDGKKLTDGKMTPDGGTNAYSGWSGDLFVTVDLGGNYAVDKFDVQGAFNTGWGIQSLAGFKVSYSVDGTTFTEIAAESVKGEDEKSGEWTSNIFTMTLEAPVDARYVRFDFLRSAGNFNWISEVEVWGTESAPVTDTVIDGALDDEIWKDAEFKKIDGQNAGTWQNKPSDYTFDYAIVEKDGYAYFAVESDKADMTQLRVWFHTNPEAKLYTHFFDVYTNGNPGGLKTNQSLTTNSGSAYDASKLEAAFDADKRVFEAKVKLEDVGATTLGPNDVNVQISDGNALHSMDLLPGNFTIDGTMVNSAYMPWIGWFDGEIPTYAGLIPKTNHWTLTPVNGEYVKYYYVDDALYVVDEAQWPFMTCVYPEGDEQAYDIEGNSLRYNFSITNGTASIRLIFKTADGTVQYMMTNTALGLNTDQYIPSNGDFKATSCSGVISLKELVESKQLYQNSDFPAAAIQDGKITFAGIEIFAIGGATVVINELAVEPASEPEPYQATVSVKENAILTDGKTGFDGNWGTVGTGDVLLVANAQCKEAPMVVTVIDEFDAAKKLVGYTIDLYHCAGVMIGYPEGKAALSVSTDGETWTDLGEFDLAAAELELGKYGTVSTTFSFDEVEAKFVKIVLNVGSNKDVLGDTPADSKIYWEFISIAEVAPVEPVPEFDEGTWEWAEGYASAKIVFKNQIGGDDVTVDATVTSEVTTEPTIYAKGVRTYTAKATFNEQEYTDVQTGEEPMLPFTPEDVPAEAKAIKNFAAYVTGDVSILVRLAGGQKTIGEITAVTVGTAKDYNAYYLILVDKDGNVVGTDTRGPGRPDGVKTDVEVPEDGYIIAVNCTGVDYLNDLFAAVAKGDKVTLYNVDLAALALLETTISLESYNAAFEVKNTIDGVFENDPVWEGIEWTHVDETNGTWQNIATRGTFTYDYMVTEDDTYVYVAVKADTDAVTMTRLWMHNNPEAELYTHFVDITTADGSAVMKYNKSLTANSGAVVEGAAIISKVVAADGKYALEYKFLKSDAGITEDGLFEYRFNVTTGGTTTLHSASMLWGTQNGKSTFPWASWTEYELDYIGLVPKTNRWKLNEGASFGGTIQQLFYQENEFIVKNDAGWPNVEFHYPEADRQTYEIDKYALYYDFTVTGQNNITLFFADAAGNEYSFPLSNSALYLNVNQYDTGSGDLKAGEFKGMVPLAVLVKGFANYGGGAFPAKAVEDGAITFSGLQVWVSGTGAACNMRQLEVKEYEPDGLEFAWAEEWKEANGKTGGTWQENNVPGVPHSYDYAAVYDAESGNVKLGVKFYGQLTGTGDSYGNGKGTNIRVWIRNPGTGYTAYNFFADISYNGSDWLTCIKQNTNPTGNTGAVLFDYNAESYPYTLNTKNTAYGADIEVIFPATLVSDSGVVQIIFAVSNKDVANYCLYHGAAGGAAAWNPWNGDQSINLSGAPMPEVTTSSENLALNKECTMGGNYSTSGTYMGKMTDGVSATAGSYTAVWHAFKIGEVTADINLGEVYENVNKVRVNIWPANKSGIIPPKSVKFYVSEDGTNYTEAGMLDMSDSRFQDNSDTAYWFETELYTAYKAQYVKMVVDTQKVNGGGAFSFFAEVEVYAVAPAEYVQPTHGYTYATDSLNVIGYKLGKTLGDVKDKTHAWWNLAVVEWDVDKQVYVVTDVKIGNGNDSDFRDVEIPLYGFVLGCHNTEMPEAAAFIASLSAGDSLYLYDIDVSEITEVDVALSENAMISTTPVDGKKAYDPGVKLGAYKITNFAKYATGNTIDIFVRQEGKTTLGDLEGKDYNYFKIIAVNKDGMVVDVNEKLGRADVAHSPADGRKDLVEIPEGGFIIGIHNDAIAAEGSVYANLFGADGLKCGDTVTLRNIDLEELATLAVGTELNKYASFDVSKKAFTSVTASNGRWQTVKDTSPELLTYKLALADDEEYLYVTVVGDGKFADDISTLRFWIRSSDDATVYTHFYDVDIAADGTVTNKAKYNKSLTANSGDNIAESSMVYAASAIGDTQTKITFKVLLSEFDGEDGFAYYAALMKKGVDYSYYPAPEGTGTASMPYKVWDIANEGLYNKERMEQPGAYKLRSFAAYVNADVNLFVRIQDGETVLKTLNEIGNFINGRTTTDYNAYKVFTVDKDGFVTGIYTTIGRPDGVKSDVEVPEGGFAIGVSVYDQTDGGAVVRAKDDAALAIFDTLKVGDYVELANVDLDEVAESHHVSAYASFDVQPISEIPEGALAITHFGLYRADICSILVPLASGEKTVGSITKVTMGSAQNFTWWNAIVVGADGKVTKVIGMVDKTNTEIPEGGFMILAHGSHPALNVLATAAVGEIVTLYNVDTTKLANTKQWKPLVKAAFTIKEDDTIQRPVSYQKNYTVTGNTRADSYKDDGVKLTDGKTSDNGGTAASSGLPTADGPSVTVDLGEAMSVNLFKVHAFGGSWGISNITGFTVAISTDGSTFTDLNAASVAGTPADATWQATWFTIELGEAVSARYVKFLPVGGNYLWTDEVEVWGA